MNGLIDATGQPFQIGKELGRGGEGSVFAVSGNDQWVAKIYHQRPLAADHTTKLQAMVALSSNDLSSISAWPRSLVYEGSRDRPCGILMPRVSKGRHLHELYGTLSRKQHFPNTAWHHMVLAARNTAAAFHTVQSTGVVIGDVNQGNLMVDADMRVQLIDCDSFQIRSGEQLFHCPVGTPHFTPPELQSQLLREVDRSVNHDGFGLAILLFHLLFMGRHPFAGRFLGTGDMTIEKAIAERRFAFSKHRSETLVDPPPASLLLEDLPPSTGELFERAFRSDASNGQLRPTPEEWVRDLEQLIKSRKQCQYDPMHVHYSGIKECPWCRIEAFGGPSFFVEKAGASAITKDRLLALNKQVKAITPPTFPDISPAQVALPSMPTLKLKEKKDKPGPTITDLACGGMALGALAALFGPLSVWAYAAGCLIALASGLFLIFDRESKLRRKTVDEFVEWLENGKAKLWQQSQAILKRRDQQAESFQRSVDELTQQVEDYQAEGKALVRVLMEQSDVKKDELLRGFLLRDNLSKVDGLTASNVAVLESYGIESAYDIEKINLYGIPMISSRMVIELLNWREEVEHGLVIKPDHGVTPVEMESATEFATQRYKASQARRVLMSASRLESVAATAEGALNKELKAYEQQATEWREMGKQFRDYQSNRTALERNLNSTVITIAGAMIAIPALGALVWSIFG